MMVVLVLRMMFDEDEDDEDDDEDVAVQGEGGRYVCGNTDRRRSSLCVMIWKSSLLYLKSTKI